MLRMLGILLICIFTSACSSTLLQNNAEENRDAVCKELKHRMIFNGATTNQTDATKQRAEMGTLASSYREQGCT